MRRHESRYLLRTDLSGKDAVQLWKFYIQPVEIEAAFQGPRGRSRIATNLPPASLLCSRSRGKARLSARSAGPPSARKAIAAQLGAERETTVDQTLIRGLVTAFRVFVSGLSSI